MKTFNFFLFAVVLGAAKLAQAAGFGCMPDPHETQFFVRVGTDKVTVTVYNPQGYSLMPQMDGSLSENDLPFLKMQAEDLRALGGQFIFEWKLNDCKVGAANPWLVRCEGESSAQETPGLKTYGFTTLQNTEDSLGGTQQTMKLRLVISKENTYFVTIPSAKEFCQAI